MTSRRDFMFASAASLAVMAGGAPAVAADPAAGIYPVTLRLLDPDGGYAPFPANIAAGPGALCEFAPATEACCVAGFEVETADFERLQVIFLARTLHPGDTFRLALRMASA